MPISSLGDLSPHSWFKADGTVLEAISGSDAAEDGDGVERWSDASGNGRHADQATSSKRPTYQTNEYNGLPCIRFDGTDDFLRTAAFTQDDQPSTLIAVAKSGQSSSSGAVYVVGAQASGKRNQVLQDGSRWIANAGSNLNAALGSVNTSKLQVLVVVFNGASSKIRVDATETTGNPGAEGTTGHTLGANQFGTGLFLGDICEVAFFSGELTSTNITDTEAHLNEKWGLFCRHRRRSSLQAVKRSAVY